VRALELALAAVPLALLWPDLRQGLEASMVLHMLLELPLLLLAGWMGTRRLASLWPRGAARLGQAWAALDWG